jgi:two-component system OmpR family response regulator
MENRPHLLIVDDDHEIRRLMVDLFEEHGFRVTAFASGAGLANRLLTGGFDLAILDLMLPGEDGLAICRRIRGVSHLPIIMLTARGAETDRVVGLEMGADDYVAKPFGARELVARVRALLRRSREHVAGSEAPARSRLVAMRFDSWLIDLTRRGLRMPDGTLVSLTGSEFDLLVALAERAPAGVSRDQLFDTVLGRASSPFDRSIDVSISRLRRKIEPDPVAPRMIRTVRSSGYVFAVPVSREHEVP